MRGLQTLGFGLPLVLRRTESVELRFQKPSALEIFKIGMILMQFGGGHGVTALP